MDLIINLGLSLLGSLTWLLIKTSPSSDSDDEDSDKPRNCPSTMDPLASTLDLIAEKRLLEQRDDLPHFEEEQLIQYIHTLESRALDRMLASQNPDHAIVQTIALLTKTGWTFCTALQPLDWLNLAANSPEISFWDTVGNRYCITAVETTLTQLYSPAYDLEPFIQHCKNHLWQTGSLIYRLPTLPRELHNLLAQTWATLCFTAQHKCIRGAMTIAKPGLRQTAFENVYLEECLKLIDQHAPIRP